MQKNMDTIDNNEDLSTEDWLTRGSYQNTEVLRLSRRPKQPYIRYGYGEHIHNLVDYTQHSLKKELNLFKENGIQALHKEINQLNYRNMVKQTTPEDMTKEDNNKVLQYLMFLNKSDVGESKPEAVWTDGHKEHTYPRRNHQHQQLHWNCYSYHV